LPRTRATPRPQVDVARSSPTVSAARVPAEYRNSRIARSRRPSAVEARGASSSARISLVSRHAGSAGPRATGAGRRRMQHDQALLEQHWRKERTAESLRCTLTRASRGRRARAGRRAASAADRAHVVDPAAREEVEEQRQVAAIGAQGVRRGSARGRRAASGSAR
jgi:hypothetical protein